MLTQADISFLEVQSLLPLLYEPSEISDILRQGKVVSLKNGELIMEQGEMPLYLVIVLEGEVELLSAKGEHKGLVIRGRSLDTKCLIRGQPHQYSGRMKGQGSVVLFPAELVVERLRKIPGIEAYLLGMTEKPAIRAVAKEIKKLGCSFEFKVHLIARLNEVLFSKGEIFVKPTSIPKCAYYFASGHMVCCPEGKEGLDFSIPLNTWYGWTLALEKLPSPDLLKAMGPSSVLTLASDEMNSLREEFPRDFKAFHDFLGYED